MVESAKTTPVPVQEQQATPTLIATTFPVQPSDLTLAQIEVEAIPAWTPGNPGTPADTPSLIASVVRELARPSKKRR